MNLMGLNIPKSTRKVTNNILNINAFADLFNLSSLYTENIPDVIKVLFQDDTHYLVWSVNCERSSGRWSDYRRGRLRSRLGKRRYLMSKSPMNEELFLATLSR